jgi:hypothetical protein
MHFVNSVSIDTWDLTIRYAKYLIVRCIEYSPNERLTMCYSIKHAVLCTNLPRVDFNGTLLSHFLFLSNI